MPITVTVSNRVHTKLAYLRGRATREKGSTMNSVIEEAIDLYLASDVWLADQDAKAEQYHQDQRKKFLADCEAADVECVFHQLDEEGFRQK